VNNKNNLSVTTQIKYIAMKTSDGISSEKKHSIVNNVKKDLKTLFDIPYNELDKLQKDFVFVCNLVSHDYRTFEHVNKYYKNNEIAMMHLTKLNKNIHVIEI
jgi:hypothetical protein